MHTSLSVPRGLYPLLVIAFLVYFTMEMTFKISHNCFLCLPLELHEPQWGCWLFPAVAGLFLQGLLGH